MATNRISVQSLKVASLERFQPHPLVKEMPVLPRESEDYRRMADSIAENGVLDPLKCAEDSRGTLLVLDGLHRLAIAAEQRMKELPYRLVENQDLVDTVCLSAVRAEWTKNALAYRMWPFFAAQSARSSGRPKKGTEFPILPSAQIAAKIGVSEKLVDQAKKVHQIFAAHSHLRADCERKILEGELTLKQIIEKTRVGNSGPNGSVKPQLLVILDRLKPLPTYFEKWSKLSSEAREKAINVFITTVFKLPDEVQKAAFEALETRLKP